MTFECTLAGLPYSGSLVLVLLVMFRVGRRIAPNHIISATLVDWRLEAGVISEAGSQRPTLINDVERSARTLSFAGRRFDGQRAPVQGATPS